MHDSFDAAGLASTAAAAVGVAEHPADASPRTYLNFAYGSNMSTRRLRERTPSARAVGIGCVRGHRLAWHKRGSDGSAKCDIARTDRDEDLVWGVLFEIDAAERPRLDRAEGLGRGYDHRTVTVLTEAASVQAGAYVATDIDASLNPFDWYLAFVLAGALEHGLPEAYANAIRALSAVVDPDSERRRRHLALLGAG